MSVTRCLLIFLSMLSVGAAQERATYIDSGVLSRHIAMSQEAILGANTRRLKFGATPLLCIAVLCSGVLSAQTPQYRVEGPKSYYRYYIYPGDVLRISVSRHPELSKTVVVTANGEIILPWLNAAKIGGLTVEAASKLLSEKRQSCVTVTVQRRNGPWVLERVPYFIDVPPASHLDGKKMRES